MRLLTGLLCFGMIYITNGRPLTRHGSLMTRFILSRKGA